MTYYKRIGKIEYEEIDWEPKLHKIEYNGIFRSMRGERYLQIYYLTQDRAVKCKVVNKERNMRQEVSEEEEIIKSIREEKAHTAYNSLMADNCFGVYYIISDDKKKNQLSEDLHST